MSINLIQPSFAAGEIAPSLYARVDLAKYRVGAAVMRNFFVDYRGGAASRPGTLYIATSATGVTSANTPPRLIPFEFGSLPTIYGPQNYVLEFGNGYIAFYKNGAPVMSGASPYTIASPYALADLPLLKFTQSADVMTLTHPNYAPMNLNRFSDTNWTLTGITFSSTQTAPTGGAATSHHSSETAAPGDGAITTYVYVVTAINASTGEESEPCAEFFNAGDSRIMSSDGFSYITLTWTAPAGATPASYNIYRQEEVPNGSPPFGSIFGLIGSATSTSYVDRNGVPNFAKLPPTHLNPFAGNNNPGCTTYYLQRQWFADSTADPETFWATKVGAFTNMDQALVPLDDDAVTDTIASVKVNSIQFMIAMPSGLIMLSSGGAWLVSGGGVNQGGIPTAITPSNIVAQPQAYNGCSATVPPIVVNYDVLFVQAKGAIVRDLSYNFYVNIYTGTDMTTLSNHLFAGRAIIQWAYAEEPYKIIWCVRDDGILLGFTYLKEQDVYAWTRHDTNGFFQSVCSVSEGQVNATYFVVKRRLGGAWVYTIERMADRQALEGNAPLNEPPNVENAWCLDCAVALAQPTPAANLYPGTGANIVGSSVVFTTDAAAFVIGSAGSVIRGNSGKATITAYNGPLSVTVTINAPFPVIPNDPTNTAIPVASGSWTMTRPVTTVSGLSYLNGMTVGILADGNVQPQQVVSNGAITLQQAASQILVGLPYQCQLQTLYLDAGEPTIQGKRKKANAVTVRVRSTRGLKAGRTFATVVPVKEWNSTINLGGPLPLITGDQRVVLDPVYDMGGQICLQLDDPVPATVLGVIPEISVGDT